MSRCNNALDVVFVVDAAGSVTDPNTNWQLIRDFMVDTVDRLEIDGGLTRVGLIALGDGTFTHEFGLSMHSSSGAVKAAINAVTFKGGSLDLVDGLNRVDTQFLTANGQRAAAVNVVIVILDQLPTNSESEVLNAARAVQTGVPAAMFSVGITAAVTGSNVPRFLASEPAVLTVNYFNVATHSDLSTIDERLADQICVAVEPSPGDHACPMLLLLLHRRGCCF